MYRRLGFSLLLIFFTSCSSVRVNYDHDKETDFSNYSTYNYYPDMKTGLSELDEKRLLSLMDVAMHGKGFQYFEEPDFLINISSGSFQVPQNTSVGLGVGGTGRNVGGGVSVGIPLGRQKLKRQIIFDFVDAKKENLFWQAVSESSFKPNAPPTVREQKLAELVEKVLSKYPPKSKQ